MENQIPSLQEKRRFGRIKIVEPHVCHIHVDQSRIFWVNQGIIRNISLGGIYFVCDRLPPLEKDEITYLTFDTLYKDEPIYRLQFHALIVRTEDKPPNSSQLGVALKFLSEPIYQQLKEINQREFASLDKTRIMFQYYALTRKADEILKKTPETRVERINNLRERIAQGLYTIESEKIAQSLTDNLLRKNPNFRRPK